MEATNVTQTIQTDNYLLPQQNYIEQEVNATHVPTQYSTTQKYSHHTTHSYNHQPTDKIQRQVACMQLSLTPSERCSVTGTMITHFPFSLKDCCTTLVIASETTASRSAVLPALLTLLKSLSPSRIPFLYVYELALFSPINDSNRNQLFSKQTKLFWSCSHCLKIFLL